MKPTCSSDPHIIMNPLIADMSRAASMYSGVPLYGHNRARP
jgi:hypothetical protein